MTDDLCPLDLAIHWPYLASELVLDRWRPAKLALGLLAELQIQSRGAPVPIGPSSVRTELGLTSQGEAHGVVRALRELARRQVVTHFTRAGGRPDVWSFGRVPSHWRAMPWRWSSRDAERQIRACRTARCCAGPRENPAPGDALAPELADFSLPREAHLGFYPVDIARSGAAARGPAQPTRDFVAAPPALSFLSELRNVDVGTLAIAEKIRELDSRGLGLSPGGWKGLSALGGLSPATVAFVCANLAAFGTRVPDRQIPNVADLVARARAEERRRLYSVGPATEGPSRLDVALGYPGIRGGEVELG